MAMFFKGIPSMLDTMPALSLSGAEQAFQKGVDDPARLVSHTAQTQGFK
jgi:hypothetical protein